jgi:predicted RNase H-like nuclease (RuvC/YqgF family)
MAALCLFQFGFTRGSRSRTRTDEEIIQLKKSAIEEIKKCYSRFEDEYGPLKAKIEVLKFELEKEQWRVRSLRNELDEERNKRRRTPELANKEAIHSVGGK